MIRRTSMILKTTKTKFIMLLLFFAVVLPLVMMSCAEQKKQRENITCDELKSIQVGMTPEQVQAIIGPPGGQDIKVGVVHWMYMTPSGTWIIKFREGKVVESTSLVGSC